MAFQRLAFEGRRIISYLTGGGALSRGKMFDMGLVNTKQCPSCSCTIQTIDHTLHFCQHPDLVKARKWEEGDPLNINRIVPVFFSCVALGNSGEIQKIKKWPENVHCPWRMPIEIFFTFF